MSIHQRIQQRRKELGLSQTEVAKKASLNPSAISQYESGNRNPSYDALIKLSGALNVNTEYLLLGESSTSFSPPLISHRMSLLLNLFKKLNQEQQDELINYCYQYLGTSKPKLLMFNHPSDYANYIVNQLKTIKFPINIIEIATQYNMRIHEVENFEEDFEAVMYNGTNKVILLLKSFDNTVRKRFTIAKLLGHAILPTHIKPEYYRTRNSTLKTEDNEEIEAQIFAEYLLIPEAEFSKDLFEFQQNKDRHGSIKYLTSKYQVSETMLFQTLVNRRENRFATVFISKEGVVTKSISKGRLIIQEGETIPILSEAAKINTKEETGYSFGTVPSHQWVKDASPYEFINEYTSYDFRYGYLTLIEFI